MKEKGGLHFGIHKLCTPFFDTEEQAQPSGVTMLPTLDTDLGEQLEERIGRGLKYPTPNVNHLPMEEYLTLEELSVLQDCFESSAELKQSELAKCVGDAIFAKMRGPA